VQFVRGNQRDWTNVKIIAFDVPSAKDTVYSERLELLKQSKLFLYCLTRKGIPKEHPFLSVVSPVLCKSAAHLNEFIQQIREGRPEGQRATAIILRKPQAWYYARASFFKKEVLTVYII
jgi:hypothetical protein